MALFSIKMRKRKEAENEVLFEHLELCETLKHDSAHLYGVTHLFHVSERLNQTEEFKHTTEK